MNALLGLLILLLIIPLLLGWIIPLVVGTQRIRDRKGGVLLTVIGGVWGTLALCFGCLIAWSVLMSFRAMQVEDFDPANFRGETGSITLTHKAESELVLMSLAGMWAKQVRFKTTDGVVSVPVGRYHPVEFTTYANNPAGTKWKATCRPFQEQGDELSINAGSPCELAVGPPFTAQVTAAKQPDNEVILNLNVTGKGGQRYVLRQAEVTATPPGFEVVGPDGKVILTDKFRFG